MGNRAFTCVLLHRVTLSMLRSRQCGLTVSISMLMAVSMGMTVSMCMAVSVSVTVSVSSFHVPHKFLHHEEGDNPTENPQPHRENGALAWNGGSKA